MNEKFKKDEVWGYLGKAKQKDNMERIEHKTNVENLGQEVDGVFVADADPKVSYDDLIWHSTFDFIFPLVWI